jgi:hypothetical protein
MSLGRPRHRWEDNTEIDLKEVGWEDVEWFKLTKDGFQWWAVVNTVINLRDP